MGVFFIDDNFAINVKRTKALLREIIRRDAVLPWVAQISMNLLRDEELLDLIKESGGRWIFIGLESIDAGQPQSGEQGIQQTGRVRRYTPETCRSRNIRDYVLHFRHGGRHTGH